MSVRTDPERTRVVVVPGVDQRPEGATMAWQVAVTVGDAHQDAAAAHEAARRLREELRLIGPEWIGRTPAAARLGVSVKMIDKLRRQGKLRARPRDGRHAYVHRDDVEARLREREAGA